MFKMSEKTVKTIKNENEKISKKTSKKTTKKTTKKQVEKTTNETINETTTECVLGKYECKLSFDVVVPIEFLDTDRFGKQLLESFKTDFLNALYHDVYSKVFEDAEHIYNVKIETTTADVTIGKLPTDGEANE